MLLSEAQALVVSKFVTLSPVDETSEAQSLVVLKTVTLAPVDETDEAQAFTETIYRSLTPVDELDEALDLPTTPFVSIGAPSVPPMRKQRKRKKRKEPVPLDLPPIDVWLEEMGVVVLHVESEDDLVLLDLLF